jgi:ribosomal protein S18 acetylase RimI-like enzyme
MLTYRELAGAAPGSKVEVISGALLCQAPIDLAFCNFAILTGHSSEAEALALADEVTLRAEARRVTRVFVIEPANGYAALLKARGFRSQQRMTMMASEAPGRGVSRAAQPVETTRERRELARFMIDQFFARQANGPRQIIVDATASSPHDLYRVCEHGAVVAAAMISRSACAWGLYNLCVDPGRRRRGIGAEFVRHLQNLSFLAKLPLTLQCEASLQPWYERLGFVSVGHIEAFSRSRQAGFDIL